MTEINDVDAVQAEGWSEEGRCSLRCQIFLVQKLMASRCLPIVWASLPRYLLWKLCPFVEGWHPVSDVNSCSMYEILTCLMSASSLGCMLAMGDLSLASLDVSLMVSTIRSADVNSLASMSAGNDFCCTHCGRAANS